MDTNVTEIADRIFQVSTFVPDAGMTFNQILIDADEPLLFHCGHRQLFPTVSAAVATVLPVERLRWISFGHVEADECGAMNEWLAAAPGSEVAFGGLGVLVSVNDLADRAPRALGDGEVVDLGGKRVRYVPTPHVPHGWDAGVLFEETTRTLLCGDLFTQMGDEHGVSGASPIEGSVAAEDAYGYTCLTPRTGTIIRDLADLAPTTLALMHGPAFAGDGGTELRALADIYDERRRAAG